MTRIEAQLIAEREMRAAEAEERRKRETEEKRQFSQLQIWQKQLIEIMEREEVRQFKFRYNSNTFYMVRLSDYIDPDDKTRVKRIELKISPVDGWREGICIDQPFLATYYLIDADGNSVTRYAIFAKMMEET